MDMCGWLDAWLLGMEFLEWTADDRLRLHGFAGLRSDKNARQVTRDGGS
jgi:hypothetical protein